MMKILQIGFSQRKITFTDLNFKLYANEDIIILPNYNVHVDVPADGYYESSRSSLVVHTGKPYVMFTITLIYIIFLNVFGYDEVFYIFKVYAIAPVTYKLKDSNNKVIQGVFYREELKRT